MPTHRRQQHAARQCDGRGLPARFDETAHGDAAIQRAAMRAGAMLRNKTQVRRMCTSLSKKRMGSKRPPAEGAAYCWWRRCQSSGFKNVTNRARMGRIGRNAHGILTFRAARDTRPWAVGGLVQAGNPTSFARGLTAGRLSRGLSPVQAQRRKAWGGTHVRSVSAVVRPGWGCVGCLGAASAGGVAAGSLQGRFPPGDTLPCPRPAPMRLRLSPRPRSHRGRSAQARSASGSLAAGRLPGFR